MIGKVEFGMRRYRERMVVGQGRRDEGRDEIGRENVSWGCRVMTR